MSIHATRQQRRQLARDNARQPKALTPVDRNNWPLELATAGNLLAVWRSRAFLVMKFTAPAPAIARLSVNRTELDGDRWQQNITWDELQAIKNELGFHSHTAVEIYPPMRHLVNVANMRHLWVLEGSLPYCWRSDS